MKGMMRFRRRVKLSPRYIGTFKILYIVGEVFNKLDLPSDFLLFIQFLIFLCCVVTSLMNHMFVGGTRSSWMRY